MPVANWMTKTNPISEPKFHQIVRLAGAGKSITTPLINFNSGWDFRKGAIDFVDIRVGRMPSSS